MYIYNIYLLKVIDNMNCNYSQIYHKYNCLDT